MIISLKTTSHFASAIWYFTKTSFKKNELNTNFQSALWLLFQTSKSTEYPSRFRKSSNRRTHQAPWTINQVAYLNTVNTGVITVTKKNPLQWWQLGIWVRVLWHFPLLSLNTRAWRRTIPIIMFLVISNDLAGSGRRVEPNYSRDQCTTDTLLSLLLLLLQTEGRIKICCCIYFDCFLFM